MAPDREQPRRSIGMWWRAKRRRLLELWVVGIVASVGVTVASASGYLDAAQARSLDLLMKLRDVRQVSDIVIVAIDDASFEALGQRQPLPRDYLARVIHGIRRSGAAVVGLDIALYATSSATDDTALAAAMREFSEDGVSRVVMVSHRRPLAGPLAELDRQRAVISGAAEVPEDSDGVIRRAGVAVRRDSRVEPAFGLAILARLGGIDQVTLEGAVQRPSAGLPIPSWRSGAGWQGSDGPPLNVATDTLWRINFVGPAGTFLTIPSSAVAALADPRAKVSADNPLKGRVVLVGATFDESRDFYLTPHGKLSGVEIHANVVHMLGTRSFIRPTGWLLSLGLQVLLVLIGGFLFTVVNPLAGTLTCLVSAVAIGVPASYLIFDRGHYWLDFMLPILATRGMAWGVDLLDRRRLREMFGLYVGEEEANKISREDVSLQSERREVSITVAGLLGFASLSEKLAPEEVAVYLGQYGATIAEVAFSHGGMVDHLSGAAVMAVFGAPRAHPDHPLLAVRSALAMHEALRGLNERWTAVGLSSLRMGVGIHTGQVVVGSIGDSRSPVRYAVVGTSVEVATQVQALTAELETTTLVTEETRAAVGDRIAVRECGTVCVKGLSEDVPVYELLDLREQGDPE